MRLIAVILTVLFVGACGGKSVAEPPPSSSTAAPAAAPMSFDCAAPANEAQQLVCNDPQLTDLDRRMQAAYVQALERPGADQAALTTAQSAFTATRDGGCRSSGDERTCIVQAYQTRLVELAIGDPATPVPPVVTYNCPGNSGPLSAQFYNDFDPQTAVLDWKGARIILFIQPSGSGARYGRLNSEYWEHQGEVTLNLSGTKFVCRTQ
jgi:uncharacterized protein